MFKKRFNRSSKREKPSIDANENKKSESNQKENVFPSSSKDYLQTIKDQTNNPSDLVVKTISPNITVTYMNSLVDDRTLKEQLIQV
jgi:hypothetical protein